LVREGDRIGIVVRDTPFYPGGGGQVCDTGTIEYGNIFIDVDKVEERIPGKIIHWGTVRFKEIV
jgi:alanyl-tRNA synthetase